MKTQLNDRAISILIAALGGQGGGVLAEWLVDAATRAGYPAQSTSIPGVAQRTGATTYYVEIFPRRRDELGGREPVLSLLPVPGCIDLLIASELLEATRIVQSGMADAQHTFVIASSSRTLTTAEKMSLGDGRFASDRLLDAARAHSRRFVSFDMDGAAREAGTVVSAVMFGAIAATGALPFGRDVCEAAIDAMAIGAKASHRGFGRGFELAIGVPDDAPSHGTASGGVSNAPAAIAAFPPSCRAIVAEGHRRLVEFQDTKYALRYVDRLAVIRDAEHAADPAALAGLRRDARDGTLPRAVDGVRRHRPRRAAEEPCEPLRAGAPRSRGWRRRRRASLRSLQARRP